MRMIGVTLLCALCLSACAPIVWDRPGTTPAQLSTDTAQCQRAAENTGPEVLSPTFSTANFMRGLSVTGTTGYAGAAQSSTAQRNFELCMQAAGYVASVPGIAPSLVASPTSSPAAPVALEAAAAPAGAPGAPGCAAGLSPRWGVPDTGGAAVLVCVRGGTYPAAFRWAAGGGFLY
jgi:hypothetical protein